MNIVFDFINDFITLYYVYLYMGQVPEIKLFCLVLETLLVSVNMSFRMGQNFVFIS